MFLGWYDPDKKKPARLKLVDARNRYVEKFGSEPEACLTSHPDADELNEDSLTAQTMIVKGIHYIPRYTYYVGQEDTTA